MRWLYVKQNPFSNLRFGYKSAEKTRRKLLVLLNSYSFFETYRSHPQTKEELCEVKLHTTLDKWIISKLNDLIGKVTKYLDEYDAYRASSAIEDFFINDLSLWYIRRSRKRFQKNDCFFFSIFTGNNTDVLSYFFIVFINFQDAGSD